MNKNDLIKAILSKDPVKINEAKASIKETLNTKAKDFKDGATKFVAKSLLESSLEKNGEKTVANPEDQIKDHNYDPKKNLSLKETHTLNGPFSIGTAVTDARKGKVGVVSAVGENGHPSVIHFPDEDPSNYGPEDVPHLKSAEQDTLPAAIKMLQGKFKGSA